MNVFPSLTLPDHTLNGALHARLKVRRREVVGHDAAGHADVRERGVLARQQRARPPQPAALLFLALGHPRPVGVVAGGGGVQPAERAPSVKARFARGASAASPGSSGRAHSCRGPVDYT